MILRCGVFVDSTILLFLKEVRENVCRTWEGGMRE